MLVTFNNKKVHLSTGLTLNVARKLQNELDVYLNMTLKAKRNRKYQEIHIGDKVCIQMQRKAKSKISYFTVV